jgi:hypothetical protein
VRYFEGPAMSVPPFLITRRGFSCREVQARLDSKGDDRSIIGLQYLRPAELVCSPALRVWRQVAARS